MSSNDDDVLPNYFQVLYPFHSNKETDSQCTQKSDPRVDDYHSNVTLTHILLNLGITAIVTVLIAAFLQSKASGVRPKNTLDHETTAS